MTALLALSGGKSTLIGGFVAACLAALGVMFRFAFKAGKNSQLAKEGQANAKALDDLRSTLRESPISRCSQTSWLH